MDEQPESAKKSGSEILALQKQEANTEFDRPAAGLALSGLSAGLDLGFSLLVIAVLAHLLRDAPAPLPEFGRAFGYSIGFLFVIMGRSELFTEHTTLDVLPVLGRDKGLLSLARLWVIIYAANLLGAAAFAWAGGRVGPALGIFPSSLLGELARPIVDHSAGVIVASGIFAGWLMGLLSWLVAASKDTVSQILIVFLVTGAIGLCHFHHCIAGSVEVLSAVFLDEGVSWAEYLKFLGASTLGNAIGGVVFVALIKHGHLAYAGRGEKGEAAS